MKLSIILPVYNGEKYIEKCLDSILQNDNRDYELIIVNDGSNDNSRKIIEKRLDERIKLYNNKNHGVSYSRNYGILRASGDYIMFVDADDYLSYDWHCKVINKLKDKDWYIFSNENISINKNILERQICGVNNDGIILAGPFSKVYKRKLIIENNIKFNEKIINGEDMLFNLNYLKKCNSIFKVEESFYKYRVNVGSATKSFNEKIINSDKEFQLELQKVTDDVIIINSSGCNGLFTIIDRICYVKKFDEAKEFFSKIDIEFYKKYDLNYLNKAKKNIIKLLINRKEFIIFCLIKIKHFIMRKIRKEYVKDI
ncbi:glycosyltransferase family 2 protein [Streptococcus thermophilus]|uniref:Putative glycosyl transferase n=1 Tax=Streptococcus thermophilus TaxID=1308 RepID=A0A4Y3UEF1_STRTR|nr:glycosyltransferase family A protein [Streptococcus thermophilus]MDI3552141.1 glycosyltransferase family 2 protein [Streptococcus thermophilus]QBR99961.1 putative glycosyl transferase [Streptococcus thermophilus]GEB93261.1 hypothetical protein STH02_12910 [Streptococcus thermophilus]